MGSLVNIIKGLLNPKKGLDLKILPSQGIFYKDDFEIYIRKAEVEDVIEYEFNYIKDDLGTVIGKLKKIVEKNTSFSKNYKFDDLKSIDVVFIFLEIVKLTKSRPITISFNNEKGEIEDINFDSNSFNYFKISDPLTQYYDNINKCFVVNGYKYTLPSIGVENSLTNYLLNKQYEPDAKKYNNYSYDFTYFLGDKNNLSFDEIDNLISIFNTDIEDVEKKKIRKIIKTFSPIHKYSLKRGSRIIEINSKIDLERIWK